ncbi:hypothetical protein K435DRAFT_584528, partial [Dendrothele bispora CBS 962.96]
MWLKAYLSFGPDRPLWAVFADALLAQKVPGSESAVDPLLRINTFLQSWNTYRNNKQIPELKELLDTAQKYNLRIEGIAFSKEMVRKMPVWYHVEADPKIRLMIHTLASKCLKTKHIVRTVGDAEAIAEALLEEEHEAQNNCECCKCTHLRESVQCAHPHGCMTQATKLLDMLPQKWDPRSEFPEDYQNKPQNDGEDWKAFDGRVTTKGELADIFRIFTEKNITPTKELPKLKPDTNVNGRHLVINEIIVATDGSCKNDGNDNARAGAGIYVEKEHPLNRSVKLPLYLGQSKQIGELTAVKIAAELTD